MKIAIDKNTLDIKKTNDEYIYLFDKEPLEDLLNTNLHCIYYKNCKFVDINLTDYDFIDNFLVDNVYTEYAKKYSNKDVVIILNSMFALKSINQDIVDANFKAVKKNSGGIIAYSGQAFAKSNKKYPSIKVYADDERHQTPNGSYLSVACTYAAIFGESPTKTNYYYKMSKSDAKKLQEICAEVMGY